MILELPEDDKFKHGKISDDFVVGVCGASQEKWRND